MQKRPVIIDTDPGVDDTLAIFLAASCDELDIRAINPVAGNVGLPFTERNALYLRELLHLDCRIGKGASRGLMLPPFDAADVHGQDGLGGYPVPPLDAKPEDTYAWDILYEEAVRADGQLEVIALGPLTNVAIALLSHPDLKGMIRQITMMAGSAGSGNITPYAEFNAYVDPHACEVVLQSGIPLYMCGLDGNESCLLTPDELSALYDAPGVSPLAAYVAKYISQRDTQQWHLAGSAIHDLITMACFIDPSIACYAPCHAECEVYDRERFGQTKIDLEDREGMGMYLNILLHADKMKYIEMIRRSLLRLNFVQKVTI